MHKKDSNRQCDYCPHPLGPHVMVMIEDMQNRPLHAGYMYCPESCYCVATWAERRTDGTLVGGKAAQRLLDDLKPIVEAVGRHQRSQVN
jgi:hypothetical protein